MTEINLNSLIISIFINDIKIIGPKISKIIKQIKINLISIFFIVDIKLISFYLSLK